MNLEVFSDLRDSMILSNVSCEPLALPCRVRQCLNVADSSCRDSPRVPTGVLQQCRCRDHSSPAAETGHSEAGSAAADWAMGEQARENSAVLKSIN